jgi:hypothetical protein
LSGQKLSEPLTRDDGPLVSAVPSKLLPRDEVVE